MTTIPDIAFEKYILSNGLNVILHEDHSVPVVSVNVWYHVGSKNEKRGRTGFAHLFEHMMFEGSQHHNTEYFEALEKIGGRANGSTSEDNTNYWEDVPSNYLELALWLESDRMGFLLPAMTQEKLDNQRDVVKNERRQSIDNQPYGKSEELMLSMLYPSDHPYSWSVIGSMDDLSAASIEDVSDFFRLYYTPNNASLCIAGDFDPGMAKKFVDKYFGSIPPGPAIDRISGWKPELSGGKYCIAEDNVSLPRLYHAWHTPACYESGDAELNLLAGILTSGITSRLKKTLMYDLQIVQDVMAYHATRELCSTFEIIATAREGYALNEIEDIIDTKLKEILGDGVTSEELGQIKTEHEASLIRSLEQVGGFGGKADRLNAYNTMLKDPGKLRWDMERYNNVSASDIQKFACQYIDMNKRAVLHIVPQREFSISEAKIDRSVKPSAMAELSFAPPKMQRTKLSNGLELLVVEDHKLPLVQANLLIKSGWGADMMDHPGAASLTAELLNAGTQSRNALDISETVRHLGANMYTDSSFDNSLVIVNVLKRNFIPALELVSDMIMNSTFPEEELERQRRNYLGRIQQEAKQPLTVGYKAFLRTLYGAKHPYGQPYTGSGTEESIKAITRDMLVDYYRTNYSASNAAAVIVGDVTLDEAREKLEKVLGSWEQGKAIQSEIPEITGLDSTKICVVNKPGAAQSVIVIGNPGIRRSDPDHLACQVMNNAFGGQFTSRLNMNLREDKGYTYGVRSNFRAFRGVGSFACYTQVQTEVTKAAVVEIIKEIRDISGLRPLTDSELADSKSNLTKGFAHQFQTYARIADMLCGLTTYDLDDDELYDFVNKINNIDSQMTTQAARDHMHPDALLIVVVGDQNKIGSGLRELGLAHVCHIDTNGNAVE